MSQPIDIPGINTKPSSRPRITAESNAFPAEDGPYFGYIEVFESGDVQWTVSSGFDKYVQVGPQRALPSLAFIVEKDRISKRITIEITSLALKQYVYRAILNQAPSPVSLQLDFDILLKHYDALKLHCQRLDARRPHDGATAELRLLVHDLLLERALYDGIGMQGFRQRQVLCVTHLQDIHLRNMDIGLDEIEDCFTLGLIPDEINDHYMDALNAKYAELARAGDYNGLHNLCEPIVRSGEIELQYNPSLLIEVLDQGHMEVYLYMLDLVDRTRDNSTEFFDPNFPDVTLNPFYVAVRLGQIEVAESFIRDGTCFEGRVSHESEPGDGHVFTPLSAAVFWDQPGIVRSLLKFGAVYFSGYQQALAWALTGNLEEILQIFNEHQHQHNGPPEPAVSTFPFALQHPPNSWASSETESFQTSRPYHEDFGTSVSVIANSLSTLASREVPQASHSSAHLIDPQLLSSPSEFTPVFDGALPMPSQSGLYTDSRPEHDTTIPSLPPTLPPEPSHPFLRQRPTHKARRKLGRDLVEKLSSRCAKIRELCGSHPHSAAYVGLQTHFFSMEDVWERGVEGFRSITRNQPPNSLVEVLHCLLIADVLSSQISQGDVLFRSQFINDLGRWRTILKDHEQAMFDETVQALWSVTNVSSLEIPQSGPEEVYHFQELIQNLVSLESMGARLPHKHESLGARLSAIRRRVEERKRASLARHKPKAAEEAAGFHNIASVLGRLTKDTDSADEEEIELGDFIHLDALQEEPDDEARDASQTDNEPYEFVPRAPWKDIHPVVVFLLASVAFSIVLALVSAIQEGLEDSIIGTINQIPSGYGRSCAIVETFLDIKTEPWLLDLGANIRPATSIKSGALITMMKASVRRTSRSKSLSQSFPKSGSYRSTLRASLSSPSGSSFLSTDLSSTDVETARSTDRFRCLSVKCPKSFSSVSNRNKHMREGCPFRDKKGYRCRNASCTKVLTTKWYRNTHEQTRCRYR